MNAYTLTLFGGQNISNDKCVGSDYDGQRDSSNRIESLPNVSVEGETVVNRVGNSKPIIIDGSFKTPSRTWNLEDIIAEYEEAFNKSGRMLHVCRRWELLTDASSLSSWLSGGRVTSLTQNLTNYQLNGGSMEIAIDSAGGGNFNISKIGLEDIDISDLIADGNVEFLLYFEDALNVESVEVRFGSDESNYFAKTDIQKAFDTSDFVNGWNLISVNPENMTQTGTVDPYSIRYVYIQVNLADAELGDNKFLFGGMWFQKETYTRNYKCELSALKIGAKRGHNDFAPFTAEFLCPSGSSETTSYYTLKAESGVTDVSKAFRVNFLGSQYPQPHIRVILSDATNVGSIIIENETTNESVTLTETFADNDIIELDMENLQILRNNVPIDYTNVLPSFKLGSNRLVVTLVSSSEAQEGQSTNNTNLSGLTA